MRMIITAALAIAQAGSLAARDLPVPSNNGWQHAETGLVLMATVDGLTRSSLSDSTTTEHDVSAQFDDPAKSLFTTLYLFHPAADDVPMWFDRSRTALEDRTLFQHASPASADPVAFAGPGSTTTSALRQAYSVLGSDFRSTALAVLPLGEWLVAIRMSTKTMNADALDARLTHFIDALRWPTTGVEAAPAAVPIRTCPKPLAFTNAKVVKPEGSDVLVSLLAGMIVDSAHKQGKPLTRAQWCREGVGSVTFGVYRAIEGDGYSLALGDSGRMIGVAPTLGTLVGKERRYSVTFNDVEGATSTYGTFASLLRPQQALELVNKGGALGRTQGTTMTLNAKTFR
jgi:hypothetical protein